LATALGLSKTTVQRVLAQAKLKPHRLERYMASNDPQFEEKAADIIGLYLNPPQHAAVFCVDEKSAIQALDRLDPVLPLSPGRAERHGFEYYRHGTLSLYAALDIKTGKVQGKTAQRHTSTEFIDFLNPLVNHARWAKEVHIARQPVSTQDAGRSRFPPRKSKGPLPLHADLLFMAQSGRTLVQQSRTGCGCAGCLHFRRRPSPQTYAVHPSIHTLRTSYSLDLY
jgi:hypothetical protein